MSRASVVVTSKRLGHAKCQFPLWADDERPKLLPDMTPLLCYALTGGGPWCAKHKLIVFEKPAPRSSQVRAVPAEAA